MEIVFLWGVEVGGASVIQCSCPLPNATSVELDVERYDFKPINDSVCNRIGANEQIIKTIHDLLKHDGIVVGKHRGTIDNC